MADQWIEKRILIWGKTYPELSAKYYETVCTGGTLENGKFIRIYPIPFRYLSEDNKFTKYQWIRAKIKKSEQDPRSESYKIDPQSIVVEESVPPDNYQWFARAQHIFKDSFFQFNTVESLLKENKKNKTSMGFVRPLSIDKIEFIDRPDTDYDTFLRKFEENRQKSAQIELFGSLTANEIKSLHYVSSRFRILWTCHDPSCKGHKMQILDWEVYELLRKVGYNKTKDRLNSILSMSEHHIGFFLGNFRLHSSAFAIGGIWYPRKSNNTPNLSLF
jgi:hypothetical protein